MIPQPKEYIITEEDMQILEKTFGVNLIMLRSRPHQPAGPQNPCQWIATCDTCENINCKHSAISAATICNETLDAAKKLFENSSLTLYNGYAVHSLINSLRSSAGGKREHPK